MNLKTIIIILSLFCFSAISQNIKQDSCQLFFSEIGIKDFNLSSTFRSFVNDSKKRKFSKKIYRIDIKEKYKNIHKYESDTIEYLDAILEYENSKKNHEISMSLKQYPTFHHLFVVYKNGSKKVDRNKVRTYLDTGLTTNPFSC